MTIEMVIGAGVLGFAFGMGCIAAQTLMEVCVYLWNKLTGVELSES